MSQDKCPYKIPRDVLEDVARKTDVDYKYYWTKDRIWGKLSNKTKEKLKKKYIGIKGAALERDVARWMKRNLKCDKVYSDLNNTQKLRGKFRLRQIDVIGVQETKKVVLDVKGGHLYAGLEGSRYRSSKAYLVECKGHRVDDSTLDVTMSNFEDVVQKSTKLPRKYGGVKIKGFLLVSSKGFTKTAIEKAREKKIDGKYKLTIYEFSGGKMKKMGV